jgi:hypothetical protein
MLIPRRESHRFLFSNSPLYSCGVGLVNKFAAKQLTIFILAVVMVAMIIFVLSCGFFPGAMQNGGLFLVGVFVVLCGSLLLLGRGGLDSWTLRTAIVGLAEDALYRREGEDKKGLDPKEVLAGDAWRPIGFIRCGLILICAGVILILLYLL